MIIANSMPGMGLRGDKILEDLKDHLRAHEPEGTLPDVPSFIGNNSLQTPKQIDAFSCGDFVCAYIRIILEDPDHAVWSLFSEEVVRKPDYWAPCTKYQKMVRKELFDEITRAADLNNRRHASEP